MLLKPTLSRRALVKGAGGSALLAGIGMPAISRAQSDVIRIGHLTPRSGFLAPLGDDAVMGIQLAADEINAAGGVNGRKIELLLEDSVNSQIASAKAWRLIERDKVAMLIGEISSASGLDTAVAWGPGTGNFFGVRPLVWHHLVETPPSKVYVEKFARKYGKPPENQSWSDYNALRIVAHSMAEMKSTDPIELARHLRSGARLDVTKT